MNRAEPGELLALAVSVAHEAGELVRRLVPPRRGAPAGATAKSSPTDLVTDADRASEALIVERLLAARPDDGLLAEESGLRPGRSGLTWVVDPIDGTTNFVYGYGSFAVSIAATTESGTLAGVVYDVVRDETFAAGLGLGATLDGTRITRPAPPRLDEALVGTGFGYLAARRERQGALVASVLPHVRDIRRSGTAAVDLCSVACGRLDAYFESGLSPWDRGAGLLVATESGCSVAEVDAGEDGTLLVVAPSAVLGGLLALLDVSRDDVVEGAGPSCSEPPSSQDLGATN